MGEGRYMALNFQLFDEIFEFDYFLSSYYDYLLRYLCKRQNGRSHES